MAKKAKTNKKHNSEQQGLFGKSRIQPSQFPHGGMIQMASQYTIYILHTIGKEKEEFLDFFLNCQRVGISMFQHQQKLGGLIVSFQ